MKRLIFSALAAAALVAPAAAPAFADPPKRSAYERSDRDWNNDRDHRWDRDRNNRDYRYERRQHYNSRYHNGYYIGRAWRFGPPPAHAYRMRDFHPGYKQWKRGDRLGYYKGRYREVDHRAYRMKAPPRGYHYVQDDRGDIILAAIATGVIAAIIAGN